MARQEEMTLFAESGLIPRGLPRLKQGKAYKDLVLNQTIL
jgi:hypothetical protein